MSDTDLTAVLLRPPVDAEAALQAGEAKYRALSAAITDGFCIVGMIFDDAGRPVDYRFLEVNAAFEAQSGIKDPVGRTALEIAPDLEHWWFDAYGMVVLTGEDRRIEHHSVAMGRTFDVHASRVGGSDSRQVAILFKDVTAERRAESALRDSEERLRLAVGVTRLGVFDWDLETDRVAVNEWYRELFGLGADDVVAASIISDVIHPDDRENVRARIATALDPAGSGRYEFEHRVRTANGLRWVLTSAQAQFVGQGSERRAVRLVGNDLDITERKRRELETACLDRIGQEIASLIEPDEIIRAIGARVAEFLDLSGVVFADLDEPVGTVTVHYGWTAADVPDLHQTFRLRDYLTDEFIRAGHAGKAFVVRDTQRDARVDAANYARLRVGAFVTLPWHTEGRWAGYIAVTSATPRAWREDEIEFLREVSSRLFPARERAVAETRLRDSEERFRSFADNSADTLWIFDVDRQRLDYLSPSFAGMYGEDPERVATDIGRFAELVHPDDRLRVLEAMPRLLAGDTQQVEYRIVRPSDGATRWIHDTGFPIRDAGERITRTGGIAQDVTERREAEAALREREEEQRLTLELVPALLWWSDPAGMEITGIQRWRAFTGQTEIQTQAFGWLDAIHPDDREATRAAFEHAFSTGEPVERQQRIRRDGEDYRWHLVRHVPVRDASGTVARWFGAAVDIDELHLLQERQNVMVAELQHRTRNLIGVVGMIMRQIIASSTSLVEFRTRFTERLEALSRAQSLLSQKGGKRIDIGDVVRIELDALGADLSSDRVAIEGEAVPLRKSTVQTLSLAIHELATNVRKYGALAGEHGRLSVRWSVATTEARQRRLFFEWTETGIDATVEEIERSMHRGGYGRELIENALPYALKAKTSYTLGKERLNCTIDMPLDDRLT